MGYGADHTKRTGTFYLKTNNKDPFCGKYASCFSCYFGFPGLDFWTRRQCGLSLLLVLVIVPW